MAYSGAGAFSCLSPWRAEEAPVRRPSVVPPVWGEGRAATQAPPHSVPRLGGAALSFAESHSPATKQMGPKRASSAKNRERWRRATERRNGRLLCHWPSGQYALAHPWGRPAIPRHDRWQVQAVVPSHQARCRMATWFTAVSGRAGLPYSACWAFRRTDGTAAVMARRSGSCLIAAGQVVWPW